MCALILVTYAVYNTLDVLCFGLKKRGAKGEAETGRQGEQGQKKSSKKEGEGEVKLRKSTSSMIESSTDSTWTSSEQRSQSLKRR